MTKANPFNIMTSVVKRIINEKSAVLELIKGTKLDGKAFYAYVLFPVDVFEEIVKKKIENGEELRISKYGIVVHSDYGEEPPEDIESKVLEYYRKNYLKTGQNNEQLD